MYRNLPHCHYSVKDIIFETILASQSKASSTARQTSRDPESKPRPTVHRYQSAKTSEYSNASQGGYTGRGGGQTNG